MQDAWLWVIVGLVSACGSEAPVAATDATDSGPQCVAGQSVACACPGGGQGAQVCLPDESAFGPCDCGGSTQESVSSSTPSTTVDPTQTTSATTTTMTETSAGPTSDTTDSTDEGSTTSESGTSTGEEGVLDGWTRRRLITIENAMPDPLDDVQVRVSISHDPDMQTEFEDVRITAANGTTLRPHWIERSTPLTDADLWVRVPSIPASGATELWLYYGNEDATDASDGDATFFFFDGFDDDALDGALWSATSEYTVGAGRLEVQTGAVYSNEAVVEVGQVAQARVQWPCCESVSEIGAFTTSLDDGDVYLWEHMTIRDPALTVQYSDDGDYEPDAIVRLEGDATQNWRSLGLGREFALIQFRLVPNDSLAYVAVLPGTHYLIFGERAGAMATNVAMLDIWVDHVFVRTFAVIDPTATVGDEEVVP